MAIDFITEGGAQALLDNIKDVTKWTRLWLGQGWEGDPDWPLFVQLCRKGVGPKLFKIGDEIPSTYTLTNGTVYDYPWIVVDFQTVELENGVKYDNIPILQAKYTNHEQVQFDCYERVVATEETAQDGYYYIGYTSSYTALNLSTGDTIPYEDYTTIYKSLWNSVYPAGYGNSAWALSYLRQYLNNSGTGYWTAQHACDSAPTTQRTGFLTYMPAEMVNALTPIKRTTTRANYMSNVVDTTYDKFWIASHSEMNFATSSSIANDGSPWAYYKQILNSDTPVSTGTYAAMIRYACNVTTSANNWWSRSANLSGFTERLILSSGLTSSNSYNPVNSNYVLPCTALV